jgi:myo-inositol-1(or 4)-monophosphatase
MSQSDSPSLPPSDEDPLQLVELARSLAERAGVLMMQHRRAGLAVTTKSSATDVVTDADQAVERYLVDELSRVRPGDAVLGEESGAQAATAASRVRWVIDPIDGTVNFLLGLPHFAVSIAAEIDGEIVAGCVHNPVSGLLFHAARGHGAFLGDERLTGPRVVPLAQAVVATGFAYDDARRARQGRVAGELLGHVGNLRRLGSAALDLCALAAGWVDAYYEGPLGEWDFAGGLLIATEAGVELSGLAGRSPGPWMVAGAHPQVATKFFALLETLGVLEAV